MSSLASHARGPQALSARSRHVLAASFASTAAAALKLTARRIPSPVPPVNTVPLFLRTIGRGCEAHIDKFPTWSALFTANSSAMKGMGIGVRERKWILLWTGKYVSGITPYYIKPSEKAIKKGKWKP